MYCSIHIAHCNIAHDIIYIMRGYFFAIQFFFLSLSPSDHLTLLFYALEYRLCFCEHVSIVLFFLFIRFPFQRTKRAISSSVERHIRIIFQTERMFYMRFQNKV